MAPTAQPLILITPWFGPWPEWIELYLETCRWNPEIAWLIPTDQDLPENRPPNVRFMPVSFAHFCERASDTLGVRFAPAEPYKLCDLKPMLGHVFERETEGYAYYGFADLDVFFGRIRDFYTDDLLADYDIISTHTRHLSGHLTVIRNTERMRLSYRWIAKWQQRLMDERFRSVDETYYSRVFRLPRTRIQNPFRPRALFREQYSTVDSFLPWIDGRPDHPRTWFWKAGRLTNERDRREFLYLHFMVWRSLDRGRNPGAWRRLEQPLVRVDWREVGLTGFSISPDGIAPIPPRAERGDSGNDFRRP